MSSADLTSPAPWKLWRFQAEAVFLIGLALLGVIMLGRASFGMEWVGDDAYTLGTASRYVLGDRPIVDSWETHFSSDMMVTPFVWVIHQLRPDGTGLVRHYRYVFVMLQLLYAFAVWRLLRGLLPPPVAMLIAWTVFVYLPYYYLLLNYNSIMWSVFTLTGLLLLRSLSEERPIRWVMIAAGVAAAVASFAYPTMIVAVPFFVLGIFMTRRGEARRPILWFLSGLGAMLAVFLVVTLVWAGTRHLAEALPWFANPGDRDMSFAAIFERFNRTRAVIGAAVVSAFMFAALALVFRRHPRRDAIALAGGIFASVATVVIAPRLPHTLLYYMDIPEACALGIGTAMLLLALVSKDRFYRRLFWLLYLPTIGMAIGAGVASLEGFETATMPAILTAVAGFIALTHAVGWRAGERVSRSAAALVMSAIGVVFLMFLVTDVLHYGVDSDLPKLTATIQEGAYAGIRTTPANAQQWAHYLEVFDPIKKAGGRVAFVEAFPTGYLATGLLPGAYSVWSNFTHGPRWQKYLDITGNYPDHIVATRIPGPNGGLVPEPFKPPMGLRDFNEKYVETYRDADFAIYARRPGVDLQAK